MARVSPLFFNSKLSSASDGDSPILTRKRIKSESRVISEAERLRKNQTSRKRRRLISDGFQVLSECIPYNNGRRLDRANCLFTAAEYIEKLKTIIDEMQRQREEYADDKESDVIFDDTEETINFNCTQFEGTIISSSSESFNEELLEKIQIQENTSSYPPRQSSPFVQNIQEFVFNNEISLPQTEEQREDETKIAINNIPDETTREPCYYIYNFTSPGICHDTRHEFHQNDKFDSFLQEWRNNYNDHWIFSITDC